MSDSNRSQLAFVAESLWGTTPGTATLKKLRFTDESLNFTIDNIQSNEIRADRQTTDLIQTGAECGGGVNFELSYGAQDDLIAAALWDAWVGVGGGAVAELLSSDGGDDFTLNASITHGIVAGQWVELTGSTADDGYHLVTGVSTNTLTVASTPGITTGEVLGTSEAATIRGSFLKNGTTELPFSIERFHDDKTQYFGFKGMVVNSMSITAAAASILTGSFDFLGKNATRGSSSIGATYTAAPTNDVMNAVSNVGSIMEGSTLTALSGIFIQELNFTLNNNVRGLQAIGTLGNSDLGVGNVECTGALNVYFQNGDLYDKYIAGTESGMSFKVEDSSGNAYIFTFPRVKFMTDAVNVGGLNTDVMENLGWQALRHATYDYTIGITRIQAS
jgi:hypothetical protein